MPAHYPFQVSVPLMNTPNGKRTGSLSLVSTPCFPNHPCIPSFSHLTAVSIPSIPFYSSSSPSPGLLSLPLTPSFRIGILIPCVAKHLLRSVLSMTPGNFFAEKTSNLSLKHEARTGAEAVLRVWAAVGEPTFTKFIFSRKEPSVRTLRSCRINQTPISLCGFVSLKALTQRLPMRLRVNMPLA